MAHEFIAKVNNKGEISYLPSTNAVLEDTDELDDTVESDDTVKPNDNIKPNTDTIKDTSEDTRKDNSEDTVETVKPKDQMQLSQKIKQTEPSVYNGMISETVVIQPFQHILPHVIPQQYKWNHFMFKHKTDETELTNVLNTLDNITVLYNFIHKNKPDISLIQNGVVVGKIHFLHMNRPDKGIKSKYYINLHLFHFSSRDLFEKVKDTVVTFFSKLHKHHSTSKHSTPHHSTPHHSTSKHSTSKHSTPQHSIIPHKSKSHHRTYRKKNKSTDRHITHKYPLYKRHISHKLKKERRGTYKGTYRETYKGAYKRSHKGTHKYTK